MAAEKAAADAKVPILHAYSYTSAVTRLLLHAHSYTPNLTRLLSYTFTLTHLQAAAEKAAAEKAAADAKVPILHA